MGKQLICEASATGYGLMRLTEEQVRSIRRVVADTAGAGAEVRVFGSRLRDDVLGGDVDLLVECPGAVEHPAVLASTLSTRIGRALHGRNVDVLLLAPNLRRLPIHEIALREGRAL
jgi:predicted nucleotidyltransferase